jgi:hypothetical protein
MSDETAKQASGDTAPDIELFCPKCAYNLTGLIEERCPECGLRFDRARLAELARDPLPGIRWGDFVFHVLWSSVVLLPVVAILSFVEVAVSEVFDDDRSAGSVIAITVAAALAFVLLWVVLTNNAELVDWFRETRSIRAGERPVHQPSRKVISKPAMLVLAAELALLFAFAEIGGCRSFFL